MSRPQGRTRGGYTMRWKMLALVSALALAWSLGVISQRALADTRSSGYLTTSGATIRTSDGKPYVIKAANWFGMETSNCAPHGLWQINLDAGMAQIASFGFNTLRLPFSDECLAGAPVSGIDARQNPSLQGKSPLQIMDAVVASAGRHGLSVILDRHRPTSDAQSELWYTPKVSEKQWIDDWVLLAKRYAENPTVVGADLHNEPHGQACWGCGDASRDWAAAATRAGNAVLAANPKLLIIVEGVERQGNGQLTWWGGGLADAVPHPITLSKPNRLVYSTHEYPASVYPQPWFSAANYPANLPALWDANWGNLVKRGTAPVLVGEFGTKLETGSDRQWLTQLVSYLKTNQISFGYWSFNPNSGDTGGLVADDWTTPQRAKLDALAPILTGGTATTPPTTAPPTTSPTTAPSTTAPPTTAPPTTAPPTTAPPTTPPSRTTPAGLSAKWQLNSSWNAGYVAQLTLTSTGAGTDGWSVSWADPVATSVANSWGMTCTTGGGRITCTGADWAKKIPAGQSVTVGLQANSPGPAPTDPALTVR